MRGKIMSEVKNLSELAEYQADAIVSHTIIKKKTGTVTFFAFDKGQELSEHTAPFDAMVYILDGEAQVTIAGKPYTVKQGEMIILPAGQAHALEAVEKFKMVLTMVRA